MTRISSTTVLTVYSIYNPISFLCWLLLIMGLCYSAYTIFLSILRFQGEYIMDTKFVVVSDRSALRTGNVISIVTRVHQTHLVLKYSIEKKILFYDLIYMGPNEMKTMKDHLMNLYFNLLIIYAILSTICCLFVCQKLFLIIIKWF